MLQGATPKDLADHIRKSEGEIPEDSKTLVTSGKSHYDGFVRYVSNMLRVEGFAVRFVVKTGRILYIDDYDALARSIVNELLGGDPFPSEHPPT